MRNGPHLVSELEDAVAFLVLLSFTLYVLGLDLLDSVIQQFWVFFELVEVKYAIGRGRHVHVHIIHLIIFLKRVVVVLILIVPPLCEGLEDIFVLTLALFVGLFLHEVFLMLLLPDLLHLPLPHEQFLHHFDCTILARFS